MPNWCSTTYRFYGDETALTDFYNKVSKYTGKELAKSDFGNNWLGNIVLGFGFEVDTESENSLRCRGSLTYLDQIDGGETVLIETETAWVPMINMWKKIIAKHYSDVNGDPLILFDWIAEECGCEIYCTNNIDTWSEDAYRIECEVDGKWDSDAFSNEEDALDFVNSIMGTQYESLKAFDYVAFDGDNYVNIMVLEEVSDDYFE